MSPKKLFFNVEQIEGLPEAVLAIYEQRVEELLRVLDAGHRVECGSDFRVININPPVNNRAGRRDPVLHICFRASAAQLPEPEAAGAGDVSAASVNSIQQWLQQHENLAL